MTGAEYSDARRRPPVLTGPRVRLRPPEHRDCEARRALGRSPEVMRMLGYAIPEFQPMTEQQAATFVKRLADHPCAWVIETDGALIGELRLDDLEHGEPRARLSTSIFDPEKLSRGFGREAISLALQFAFETLDLHRVALRVLAFNERAIRCYQSAGFSVEGRERETIKIDGAWHDDLIMGLLSREFTSSIESGGGT